MSAASLQPGATLGRYEILSRIASGGMADVWLARATGVSGFRKRIVIKTILAQLESDPEFVRMFINEALVASGLNHPNIVQIFDLGQRDGSHFIAMEHVPGRSLRQIIKATRAKGAPIPRWFALEVMAAACEALQYAHDFRDESGAPLDLVHSDVSPENIMVSYAGVVKVLDFGLAKASLTKGAAKGGIPKGKHPYMAPECFGGRADRRADVYAAGVVLYELLTGARPFQSSNPIDLIWQITNGTPRRPSEAQPEFPKDLEALLFDAIARDPERRIGQAAELQRRIEEHLDGHGGRSPSHALGDVVRGLFPDDPEAQSSSAPHARGASEAAGHKEAPAREAGPTKAPAVASKSGDEADELDDMVTPVVTPSPPTSRSPSPFTAHNEPAVTRRPASSWPGTRRDARGVGANPSEVKGSEGSRASGEAGAPGASDRADAKSRAAEHFEIGLGLVRRGDMDSAMREWRAAVELDPGNRDYEFNIQHLKKRIAQRGPG